MRTRQSGIALAVWTGAAMLVALVGAAQAHRQKAWLPPAPIALMPLADHLSSKARAINRHGEVAGFSFDGRSMAIVWDRRGRPWPLDPLQGDSGSEAFAINDRGQVAGDLESFARAINARGEVAGYSFSPGGSDTAVLWDRRGKARALSPLPGGQGTEAHAINRRGTVAGDSQNGAETPTRWKARAGPAALPLPPADADGHAFAINHRDATVGVSISRDGLHTAVLWRRGAPPVSLPALPGDDDSFARGINGRGDVVGFSSGEAGFTGVLWPAAAAPRLGEKRGPGQFGS